MDPIADLLTRMRNAIRAKHEKVDVPHSSIKEGIVKTLKEQGMIKHFRVVKDNKQGVMRIYLKYSDKGQPVMTDLKRESRPGLRKYVKVDNIPQVRSGFGLTILSTSQGVFTGEQAKEKNLGGELLCSVW